MSKYFLSVKLIWSKKFPVCWIHGHSELCAFNLIFYISIGAMDFHQVFDMVLLVYICFCTRILYPFTQRWRKTCLRRKWLHLFWQIWPDHNQGDLLRTNWQQNSWMIWNFNLFRYVLISVFGLNGTIRQVFFCISMIFFHWQLFW